MQPYSCIAVQLFDMRAHPALLAATAALLLSLCPSASSQSSSASKDIDGKIFFPQGQAPPPSSVKVDQNLCSRSIALKELQCQKHRRQQELLLRTACCKLLLHFMSGQVALTLEGGRQLRAYPKADMSWRLHGVPTGAHALDTAAMGFVMPSVHTRLLISCRSMCRRISSAH